MREAGWLKAAGLAFGLVSSLGASISIRKLLFGVQAWTRSLWPAWPSRLGWRLRWRVSACPPRGLSESG
jgi:hypothetical protein